MARNMRRLRRPALSGRVRSALRSSGKVLLAAFVCLLWLGLSVPALALLPGLGGIGDQGISISLQSALLGIDEGGSPSAASRAASALGLDSSSLTVARGGRDHSSLVVDLRPDVVRVPSPQQSEIGRAHV